METATIRVLLDETVCHGVDTVRALTLATHRTQSGMTVDKGVVATQHVSGECRQEFAGLAPGEYEVWFQQGEQLPTIVRQLSVGPGELSELLVDANTVVSGTVTLNGTPLPNTTIQITQKRGLLRQVARGRTDTTGQYQLFLAGDGPYSVQFSQARDPEPTLERVAVIGQDRDGVANPGINHMDWLLEGGTLVVSPVGWDGRQALELLVERMGQTTGVRGVGLSIDSSHPRVTLPGLPLGEYQLQWLPTEPDSLPARVVTLDAPREMSVRLAVPPPKR
jgi:hypothetical protein